MKVEMPEKANCETNEQRRLMVGDVVRLNSGGPLMTVTHVPIHRGSEIVEVNVSCHGVDVLGKMFHLNIDPAALTRLEVDHSQLACWQCAVSALENVLRFASDGQLYCKDCHPEDSASAGDANCCDAAVNVEATEKENDDKPVIGYILKRQDVNGWLYCGTEPDNVAACLKDELSSHEGLSLDELGSICISPREFSQREIDEMPEFPGW